MGVRLCPSKRLGFAEHQEAKLQSRKRDAADIASGRRSLQEVAQANGGIGAFVRRGSMKLVRRPVLSGQSFLIAAASPPGIRMA